MDIELSVQMVTNILHESIAKAMAEHPGNTSVFCFGGIHRDQATDTGYMTTTTHIDREKQNECYEVLMEREKEEPGGAFLTLLCSMAVNLGRGYPDEEYIFWMTPSAMDENAWNPRDRKDGIFLAVIKPVQNISEVAKGTFRHYYVENGQVLYKEVSLTGTVAGNSGNGTKTTLLEEVVLAVDSYLGKTKDGKVTDPERSVNRRDPNLKW